MKALNVLCFSNSEFLFQILESQEFYFQILDIQHELLHRIYFRSRVLISILIFYFELSFRYLIDNKNYIIEIERTLLSYVIHSFNLEL